MKEVRHTSDFFLAFTDELEKQIFIKKLLKWANKKQSNFNMPVKNKVILTFTMLHFLKKIKKNTWRYHYFTPVYQKSQYDLQFLRYRV